MVSGLAFDQRVIKLQRSHELPLIERIREAGIAIRALSARGGQLGPLTSCFQLIFVSRAGGGKKS